MYSISANLRPSEKLGWGSPGYEFVCGIRTGWHSRLAVFDLRVTPTALDCLTHAASLASTRSASYLLLTEQTTLCIDCKLFAHVELLFYGQEERSMWDEQAFATGTDH